MNERNLKDDYILLINYVIPMSKVRIINRKRTAIIIEYMDDTTRTLGFNDENECDTEFRALQYQLERNPF